MFENIHKLGVALPCYNHQGGPTLFILRVHVRARVNESLYRLSVAIRCCFQQVCPDVPVSRALELSPEVVSIL